MSEPEGYGDRIGERRSGQGDRRQKHDYTKRDVERRKTWPGSGRQKRAAIRSLPGSPKEEK